MALLACPCLPPRASLPLMSGHSHRRAHRAAALSLVALFALLSSLLLGAFVHTDDGCMVERHCQTCVFAMHHADGAPSPAAVAPASRTTELSLPLPPETISVEASVHASRGPPAA
jgi:hypothetical protein